MSNNNKKIEVLKSEIEMYSEFIAREAISNEIDTFREKINHLRLEIAALSNRQNVAL